MKQLFKLVAPKTVPVLDPEFRPPVLANRAFLAEVDASGKAVPFVIAVERDQQRVSRFATRVFAMDDPRAGANYFYVERILKFLLWQFGGWKVTIFGPKELVSYLESCYTATGVRRFDAEFWGDQTYEHEMQIVHVDSLDKVPAENDGAGSAVELNWKGWRIGFDLGASDRKVAVAKDGKLALKANGEPVLSEEYVWDPKPQTNIKYHYDEINWVLKEAEKAIKAIDPQAKVEAIGGSSAGVYVDGRVRVASLFRGITPRERFDAEAAPIFKEIAKQWGIPLRLENDGDVTALAGSISLGDGAVLGLAMGSSLAGGYVDDKRAIKGWMNELAFAPVDYNPLAATDEWSRDFGVGANYFSQQAVARLIGPAGLECEMAGIDAGAFPLRLKRVQELMEKGDARARKIYETIGVYLGYTVAHYADFYKPIRHIEVLGRVVTGEGGKIILDIAKKILREEFPEIAGINFYEPDEREKRHGQAAAAASLPLTK
ncbi:MAG: ROK family protein [Victivallales bacterium]|nr:ROK family protein [Victivallales bacterium]